MKIDNTIAAVVTGGASGLGEASARALAAKGAKVAIFDLNAERGEAVARDIGGVFCQVDVSDEASVDAGFAKARAAHGQERVLVCCAGIGTVGKTVRRDRDTGEISHRRRPVQDHPGQPVRHVPVRRQVRRRHDDARRARGRRARGDGLTACVAADDGQIGQVAYAATKAGVAGMTLPIARDLMSEGIRINTILPGIFSTPLMVARRENARNRWPTRSRSPSGWAIPRSTPTCVMTMIENGYFNGEDVRLDGAIRMGPK